LIGNANTENHAKLGLASQAAAAQCVYRETKKINQLLRLSSSQRMELFSSAKVLPFITQD
jgi:hypothetical protein